MIVSLDIRKAPVGLVTGQAARAVEDCEPAVLVGVHPYLDLDEVVPVPVWRDLQTVALVAHAVVVADHALDLQVQNLGQIARVGHEGAAGLGRGDREAGVVLGHEALGEEAVGRRRVVIPARRSSCGSRFCNVPKTRSIRPRASGE